MREELFSLSYFAQFDYYAPRFRCSRASDECNKKQPSDCDTLEYRNGEGTFAISTKFLSLKIYIIIATAPRPLSLL